MGIIRRASAKEKELPKQLKQALMIQSELIDFNEIVSIKKDFKKNDTDVVVLANTKPDATISKNIAPTLLASSSYVPLFLDKDLKDDLDTEPNMQMQSLKNTEKPIYCLQDQGGSRMDISKNICGTLLSSMGGHIPIVANEDIIVRASCHTNAEICENISPTLLSSSSHIPIFCNKDLNNVDVVVMASTKPNAEICENISPTLTASSGLGGGNVPIFTTKTEDEEDTIVMGSGQKNAAICKNICPTLTRSVGSVPLLFENHGKDSRYKGPLNVSPTVTSTYGTGGNNVPLVTTETPETYCIASNTINREHHNGGNGKGFQKDISYTITTADIHAIYNHKSYQDIVGTLLHRDHKGVNTCYVLQDKCIVSPISNRNLVRRLTPLECERLQGFPDGWTEIEKCSDSARYKALGNSVAIPCVEYVMRGIAYFLNQQYELNKENID